MGFTTVIRHESPLFSIAGTEPIKLGCLSRLVTGRYPIFGFFTNTGHPRIQWLLIISHHYPHLDCYILNRGGIYIFIYIYVNMHSPMSGQTCYIWFHHIHIQIRIQIQIQMHMKCLYTYIKIYPVDTCRCCMTWMNENSRDIMIDIYRSGSKWLKYVRHTWGESPMNNYRRVALSLLLSFISVMREPLITPAIDPKKVDSCWFWDILSKLHKGGAQKTFIPSDGRGMQGSKNVSIVPDLARAWPVRPPCSTYCWACRETLPRMT